MFNAFLKSLWLRLVAYRRFGELFVLSHGHMAQRLLRLPVCRLATDCTLQIAHTNVGECIGRRTSVPQCSSPTPPFVVPVARGRKFPAAGRISPRTSVDSPRKGSQHQTKRSKAAGSPPRSASPGNSSACACPALAASPKPEQLPMPTTGLLSRAFVHGRSPSPPKDAAVASFFAYNQVQQLIRPVAA